MKYLSNLGRAVALAAVAMVGAGQPTTALARQAATPEAQARDPGQPYKVAVLPKSYGVALAWPKVGGQTMVAPDPPTSGVITLKRAMPGDTNNFYMTADAGAAGGKGTAIGFTRGGGVNDSGTAHETWRPGQQFKADRYDQNSWAGGYMPVAASSGAWDYAIGVSNAPAGTQFAGSFHGGETIRTSQVWTCDGVPFNPLTDTVNCLKFELTRGSTVVASNATNQPGATFDVDYTFKWEQNDKVEQAATFTGTAVLAEDQGYPVMAFTDSRYTELRTEDCVTLLKTYTPGVNDTSYSLPLTTTGGICSRDPLTGDTTVTHYTVTGKSLKRVFIWYDGVNYQKLYVMHSAGAMGTFSVTSTKQFFNSSPGQITAPFTDSFTGTQLTSLWKRQGTAAFTQTFTGSEWYLVSQGGSNGWLHPINPTNGPGTYRVELDYQTDTAQTSATAVVKRSDTTSGVNGLTAPVNLNSTTGATYSVDLTIAAGETPWFALSQGVSVGRNIHVKEFRVIKLP